MNDRRKWIIYVVIFASAPTVLVGCVGFGVTGDYKASGTAVAADINTRAEINNSNFVAVTRIVNTQSSYGLYGFIVPIIPIWPTSDMTIELRLTPKSGAEKFVPGSLKIQSERGVLTASEIKIAPPKDAEYCRIDSAPVIKQSDWEKPITIDTSMCLMYLFKPRPTKDFSVTITALPEILYKHEYHFRGGIEGLAP